MISKILILFIYVTDSAKSSLIVTSSGPVLGKLVENDNGVTYYAYQGIPYAESPEGELRFKPPVPKKKWTKVFDARKIAPICPQTESFSIISKQMSEDCLRLNIVVPATNNTISRDLRPVFFYIHGGNFKSGSGDINEYQPQWFLKQDIIYVSVNYRLGALGFLQLNVNEKAVHKEDAAGNAGIKDVLLALTWIKNNIKVFGGSSITIGGESAGAAMVHYLLLTEKSKGLFDRAILKSGSATNFRFFSEYPKHHTLALAKVLGLQTNNSEVLIQKLRNANVYNVIKAQESIHINNRNYMRPFAPFLPTIEKQSSHAVLTKHPKVIIESGMPQNVPILTGINSQEGLYMLPSVIWKPARELKDNFTLCIPYDIEYPINSKNYKELVTSISHLYFGGPDLNKWSLKDFIDLLSDTQYSSSVDLWLRVHTQNIFNQPVYYYDFDFNGDLNMAKILYNIPFPGTAHVDNLGYMFITDVTQLRIKYLDTNTRKKVNNILSYLTNFIKSGNPNSNKYDVDVPRWLEAGPNRNYLLLNNKPMSKSQPPFKTRFDFWDNVYKQYNRYLKGGGLRQPRLRPNFDI